MTIPIIKYLLKFFHDITNIIGWHGSKASWGVWLSSERARSSSLALAA
jgi:hypothetical protein